MLLSEMDSAEREIHANRIELAEHEPRPSLTGYYCTDIETRSGRHSDRYQRDLMRQRRAVPAIREAENARRRQRRKAAQRAA